MHRATLARNVELCMTDVLIQLLEDVGLLGTELTELILEQFEKFEKVTNQKDLQDLFSNLFLFKGIN